MLLCRSKPDRIVFIQVDPWQSTDLFVRFVVYLSRSIEIVIPETKSYAVFTAGRRGQTIIISADTADVSAAGHISNYLNSDAQFLQLPFAGGKIPHHKVLYNGVCKTEELSF